MLRTGQRRRNRAALSKNIRDKLWGELDQKLSNWLKNIQVHTNLRYLLPLVRPRTVRINPALDLRNALLMSKDQLCDLDSPPHQDCSDRNQPNAKTDDRLHYVAPASKDWWS